jgi:hypothetical protein
MPDEPKTDEESKEKVDKGMMVEEYYDSPAFGGATSFAELDAAQDAKEAAFRVGDMARQFAGLADNIMASDDANKTEAIIRLAGEFAQRTQSAMQGKAKRQPLTDAIKNKVADITKAEMKTEDGVKFPASDFAFAPDKEKPSTWKLRLAEGRPGNITKAQLGRAAAALSPGGFRGNRVQLPADSVGSVKARIRREYGKLDVEPDDIPASVKEIKPPEPSFSIKALEGGGYRWTAIYSNNFRDDDNPPEIISEASHRRFEKMVDEGEAPMPELWYWHNKDWKLGVADWLAWDDLGFAIASGLFYEAAYPVAVKMIANPDLCNGVSHGMPLDTITYDPAEERVIIKHITKEISPLPKTVAANKLTGFIMDNKEAVMAVSDNKQEAAAKLGILDTEEATAKQAQVAAELELESKEQTPPADPPGDEVVELIKALRAEVAEVVDAMGQRVNELITVFNYQKEQIDELTRADHEKIKEAAELTPAASLTQRFNSVIGATETKINGNEARRKEWRGPEQAPARQAEPGVVGFVDRMKQANQEKMAGRFS